MRSAPIPAEMPQSMRRQHCVWSISMQFARLDVPVDAPRAVQDGQAGRQIVQHVQDGREGALCGAPPACVDARADL